MTQYLVKYSVLGDFGMAATVDSDTILIRMDSHTFRLFYCFESNGSYKEVLAAVLYDHLNLPDLVYCVLGSSWGGCQIDLYENIDPGFELVGQFFGEARNTSFRHRLFLDPRESLVLLERIILSQIGFRSRIRNVVLTALSVAGTEAHLEILHQWAWMAFEWFNRSLADKTGFVPLLDYDVMKNGQRTNLRKMFHQSVRSSMNQFIEQLDSAGLIDQNSRSKLGRDRESVAFLSSVYSLEPFFMEIYDNNAEFFRSVVVRHRIGVKDRNLSTALEQTITTHDSYRDLIHDAKDARDGFSHGAISKWKRTGFSDIEGTLRFRALASVWLLTAMTALPHEFDRLADQIRIVPIPRAPSFLPPSRAPTEGVYQVEVQGADGEPISETSKIAIDAWDLKARELKVVAKERMTLFESFHGCTYPYQKPIRADCTVSCGNMEFIGLLDAERMMEGHIIRVYKWWYR